MRSLKNSINEAEMSAHGSSIDLHQLSELQFGILARLVENMTSEASLARSIQTEVGASKKDWNNAVEDLEEIFGL